MTEAYSLEKLLAGGDGERGEKGQPHGLARSEQDEDLLDAYSRAVVGVAEKVGPAVVGIGVRKRAQGPRGRQEGAGAGVIIAPDGFILTNNHLVEGAQDVEGSLTGGGMFPAQIGGGGPAT